jgi:hypothetical protein
MAQPLPDARRKEIFLALVDAQDHDMPVDLSRKVVAERFGVSEAQVRQIEREGLDNDWPRWGSLLPSREAPGPPADGREPTMRAKEWAAKLAESPDSRDETLKAFVEEIGAVATQRGGSASAVEGPSASSR